ncbi:SpaA isopeptide-forming pilin-related protein [uncultured Streptococcus sp.]|uniref:SpaA isopeptide-forming pilin-related protein n=1 Tax=uncultured Streptococcus sp. TaxID=83427 RepID=UPI0025E9677F|nr:SpaA isopeptide-forming pilin-related protein [uncultured Streptococcus sp.]
MNKRIRALLHLIILCLGVILPSVAPLTQVQAAEFGDVITEMSLKNSSGGDLTQGIDIWETFRVYAKFVLPDNQVHQGDTTKITLPSEYAFGNSSAIELKDGSDNVVANGFLDSTNKTITLTYTNYVEQKSGVQGEFFFYARVDHDVVRQEGDLNGGFTVGGRMLYPGIVHYNGPPKRYDSKIEKSSYQAAEDGKNEVHYNIAINRNMEHYTGVTITDKITSPNFKIMRDSIRVYKIAWRWNNGDWVRDSTEDVTANFQSKITENAAGDGFTIDLGDMDGFGYLLDYKTKADYDLVDGERVSNSATMTYNGGQTTTSAENRSYQIAGGVGEGYVFTIKLHKVNENGENLQGAEFEVVRDRSGAVVGKLTTDSNGNANLGDLLRDDYTIREVTPPRGYDKLTEEIKIGAQDFGTDKSVSREIVNKKTVTEQDVTFKKVDPNGKLIPGAELKIYKGDHVEQEEAPVADWTSEENTSKVIKLSPGTYTLTEANAPAGYQYVEDITFTVGANGTVTLVKKGAEDTVQAAGSILTITDKEDNSLKAITFSKVNLGGTEIAGAQIKIYKGEKAEGTAVESWTSEANQSKDINLPPGTYTFHEEAAPTGYLKVTDITFQVKHDGTVEVTNVGEKDAKGESNTVATNGGTLTITDKDDDLPRKITFSKVNLGGTEIAGAEIKIYKGEKAEGNAVESWTSEAGKSKDINLAPGTYTFHEEAAPTGYLKVTDITFQVKTDGTVEVTNVGEKDSKGEANTVATNGSTLTVTDKDDDLPRKITFSKVNLGGTEIAGAQIKIYKGEKAEGNAVESWTSEANQSKDINLTPGTYTFHEEAAPTGYLKVTDITFQVKHDGTVEVTNVGEKDAKGEANTVATNGSTVTVTNKDDDLPRKVTFSKVSLGGTEIAGAQIKIYKGYKAEGTAVESWTSEAGKSKDLNLTPGTYTFHEEAAPTGYLKVTDITFQVKHDGTVEVTSVGEKDSKGEDNKVVTNGSTVTVTDKDDDLPRKITFSKVNLGGTEVAGAQIKIFKGDKAEGTAVESWTSEAGQSKDINLTPGTYTFHEEAAPTGYLKVTDITFQVNHDGTVEVTNVGEKDAKGEENKVVTNGSTVTVTDKDDDLPRKITFSKVNLGGAEIAGAEIKIYKGEKAEGNAVESWTSEAGKSTDINLTPGTYTFHEEAAPTGYLKVTDITFQVKHDGTVEVTNVGEKDAKGEANTVATNGSTVTVTDKDDDLPRKITFSKVNLGGTEIAGAEIKIYKGEKAEGNAVESWTSEAGKSKEINLAPGTYTFHEEAAPTGYLKVTDITFQVKTDGTVEVTSVGEKDAKGEENKVVTNGSTVTVTDKDDDLPRKITFSKVNLGGTEIAGAEIQIFQGKEATGNPVAKWTSEANTSHELGLAPGVYTFHEAAAPTGYLAVTDIVFQVNLDGTVTVVNANGNTVEYKDGTLVVTDQTKPTGPDKDPSKKTDEPDPKKSNQDKPTEKDQDKPGDKGKTKKILPFTGTEISFTLLAIGLIIIVGCGVYFGIRFKK